MKSSELAEDSITTFSNGKGKARVILAFGRGKWFVYPCPVHFLVPVVDGIEVLVYTEKKKQLMLYSWEDIKAQSSDGLPPGMAVAFDSAIARCAAVLSTKGCEA